MMDSTITTSLVAKYRRYAFLWLITVPSGVIGMFLPIPQMLLSQLPPGIHPHTFEAIMYWGNAVTAVAGVLGFLICQHKAKHLQTAVISRGRS